MKKILLSAAYTIFLCATGFAQPVTDTVSLGSTYVDQVWYSLESGTKTNAPKNNWDIAFDVSGFGSTILINSITGTTLWKYPMADIAGWGTLDTTGLSTWPAHWNSDTSWAMGAIGRYTNPADPTDLDWGLYNMTTHIVTGDSLYIIKLASGDYKKLWIESLASSVYTFKYADIDGSNEHEVSLDKATYTGKNFGYYSLQGNAALDREPVSVNWDLLFTQYTTFIPSAYTVTGVLSNSNITVAKCTEIANTSTFTDWGSASFLTAINTIGYDWKTYTGSAYEIEDSTVYFVKTTAGDIWKIIFTGFGGSVNGNCIFSKEKLQATSGIDNVSDIATTMALYPNPSANGAATIIYNFNASAPQASLTITDISGRCIHSDELEHSAGLHQYRIPSGHLLPGMYVVSIKTGNSLIQQKLIVQ